MEFQIQEEAQLEEDGWASEAKDLVFQISAGVGADASDQEGFLGYLYRCCLVICRLRSAHFVVSFQCGEISFRFVGPFF